MTRESLYIVNVLEKIQSQLEHLNGSERKAAEVTLASPDNAIHSSIVTLALKANVSELTVNRSCCSMDTCGFSDLKLHLAQSLTNGTPYVNYNINEDDGVESYTGKISEPVMATLDHVRHSLNRPAINHVADLLIQVKKIAFFRLGSLAAVVHDTMNKFFCFNVPVVYFDDIVLQRMSCMNCSDEDVAVLISHTGRTKNLAELAQLARENDAMIVALTSAGTPLAREATLAIVPDVPRDTDIYMPMVSRLAQLTVIDVLATGFTLRRGAESRDNLKRVEETLKGSRFDKQLLNLNDDR